tara:strand:- start:1668 stop:2312 length:645 start_codon:yes stop_codon:yes gene_type:complete
MDEEISIISSNNRNEKIKKFFLENKNKLVSLILIIILCLSGFFGYEEFNKRQRISISNEFNSVIMNFSDKNKKITINKLENLVKKKDPTYSPLALYFIIDNKLIIDNEKINNLFDILIQETPLKKEIKNLIIYKKALLNAEQYDEGKMLSILNPVINSDSVWKSHALYLMAEFFYFKRDYQKSKEFLNQIINLEQSNVSIKQLAQKRLNRDLSE